MGTDAAEVAQTPTYPSSFKVHHMMCTELRRFVDRIVRIFPEIEAARPRCTTGINALCLLNSALERAKLLLQYCSESSKLYLAITTDAIVSRCVKSRNLLEQSLCQIQGMVPVKLAVEISQIVDELRAANFMADKFEEEAGKVVRELLQRGAAASDSMEYAEMKALQTAAFRLHITSSTAILIEKRAIKKLLEKVGDADQQKKKILKYLLYLLRKYANLIISEQIDNTSDQKEGAFAVNNPCSNFGQTQSVDVESYTEYKRYDAHDDRLSSALPPEEFKCPISSRLMYDPVVIASGQTYERFWIQKWFDDGNDRCPKTNKKLAHLSLTLNAAMKDLISKWCMKYGITIQNPSMQPNVFQSLENSSTSIASLGSSMNDLRFPVDISSISLASLDTSYTSDSSRNKIADVISLKREQTRDEDDLCQYQSHINSSKMDLEDLSSLAELDLESQYKMLEDMRNRLRSDDLACLSMTSKNFIEPLIEFLSSDRGLHDKRALKAGFQLLLTFLSKHRNGVRLLHKDAYSLLSSFLDSEVTKEVLDIMEVLSGHSSSRSKIVSSGALVSILNILISKITDFQECVIKILCNLSLNDDVCSNLVSLECIPKFVPFLEDRTLARHCIALLRNLCSSHEARASITQATGCITSVAALLETDSYENQENALAILLALCSQSVEYSRLVMDECDNIIPDLVDVSVNGSEKGKVSALEVLRLLRDTSPSDDEQEYVQAENVISEDVNNFSKDKKSHKSLFGVKLPIFSKSNAQKKKK
ncbi:hypothetical protein CCACVL1_26158 [Corchorus capsularis]|uniref:RING-type E3 ubiquitin transferase n=1 Tax=Corchorus capsularis TaxID=210143 RepID=A0A1R3GFT4_COCAP|nr:hypothetical protein CCACVL1_26158 [Corchorus capsularis]